MPPFVVFSNMSLQEMAYYLPQTIDDFGRISGVGAMKQKQFGKVFLRLINDFARENGSNRIKIPKKRI